MSDKFPPAGAVQNSLMMVGPGVSQTQRDAAFRTQMFITNVTNGLAKDKGLDPADPAVLRSQQYFELTVEAIETYTKWVTVGSSNAVGTSRSVDSGNIDLSDIMGEIISVILDDESAGMFSGLSKLLEGGVDTGVSDFMNFWWNHTHRSQKNSSMKWGTVTVNDSGFVNVPVAHYNFDFELDDWRVLFVSAEHQSFSVEASKVSFLIDMDVYLDSALPDLIKRQQEAINSGIMTAPGSPPVANTVPDAIG